MELYDSLLVRGKGVGLSVRRHNADWLCEFHVVGDCSVTTIVLCVVTAGTGWEAWLIAIVIPVLLSLQHAASIRI